MEIVSCGNYQICVNNVSMLHSGVMSIWVADVGLWRYQGDSGELLIRNWTNVHVSEFGGCAFISGSENETGRPEYLDDGGAENQKYVIRILNEESASVIFGPFVRDAFYLGPNLPGILDVPYSLQIAVIRAYVCSREDYLSGAVGCYDDKTKLHRLFEVC